MMTPPTSDALRAELSALTTRIEAAIDEWNALTNSPQDFRRRALLASTIEALRAEVDALPPKIDEAHRREMAIEQLRAEVTAIRATAEGALRELLARIPSREEVARVVTQCQQANAVAARLEAYGVPDVPRPLAAPRQIKLAVDPIHRLFWTSQHTIAQVAGPVPVPDDAEGEEVS